MSPSARRTASGRGVARPSATPAELEVFYRELFMPLVRRATWTHGLEKEDARDIVQEAFVLALAKIDAHGNPKAWLIQVVDNLCINLVRKAARRARLAAKWHASCPRQEMPDGGSSDIDFEGDR
jgi:DNA-directed RNA polymerase specialized sigma24 family protein